MAKHIVLEKEFALAMSLFVYKIDANANPCSSVYFDVEIEGYFYTLIAMTGNSTMIDFETYAIAPNDIVVPKETTRDYYVLRPLADLNK